MMHLMSLSPIYAMMIPYYNIRQKQFRKGPLVNADEEDPNEIMNASMISTLETEAEKEAVAEKEQETEDDSSYFQTMEDMEV